MTDNSIRKWLSGENFAPCPKCESNNIMKIVYTEETEVFTEKNQMDEIILRDIKNTSNSNRYCKSCKFEFYKPPASINPPVRKGVVKELLKDKEKSPKSSTDDDLLDSMDEAVNRNREK